MVAGLCDQAAIEARRKKSLSVATAIRCGLLCKECRAGQCRSLETKRFECVSCYGKGCRACSERGWTETDECPQKLAGPMASTVEMIDMAEKGHLPVSGGVLDQAAWFIEAYRFYASDMEKAKAKAMK